MKPSDEKLKEIEAIAKVPIETRRYIAQLEAENETLKRENGRLRGFLDTIMLNWEKHRVYKTLLTAEEKKR